MLLDLSGVFAGSESLPFEYEMDLSDLEFSGYSSLKKPVKIKGAAKNRAGVVFIELVAEYVISAPCDRCAADIERKGSSTVGRGSGAGGRGHRGFRRCGGL